MPFIRYAYTCTFKHKIILTALFQQKLTKGITQRRSNLFIASTQMKRKARKCSKMFENVSALPICFVNIWTVCCFFSSVFTHTDRETMRKYPSRARRRRERTLIHIKINTKPMCNFYLLYRLFLLLLLFLKLSICFFRTQVCMRKWVILFFYGDS